MVSLFGSREYKKGYDLHIFIASKYSNSKLQIPTVLEFDAIFYSNVVQCFPDDQKCLVKEKGTLLAPVIVSLCILTFSQNATIYFIIFIACRPREWKSRGVHCCKSTIEETCRKEDDYRLHNFKHQNQR